MEYRKRETPKHLPDAANSINSVQEKAFYPEDSLQFDASHSLRVILSPFSFVTNTIQTPHAQGCNGYQDGGGSSEPPEGTVRV